MSHAYIASPMLKRSSLGLLVLLLGALSGPRVRAADADGFIDSFSVAPQNFTSAGRSDYFVLEPGFQLIYVTKDGDKGPRLLTTVLAETETIAGVETRVVESVEMSTG